jgi:hypothetical protein
MRLPTITTATATLFAALSFTVIDAAPLPVARMNKLIVPAAVTAGAGLTAFGLIRHFGHKLGEGVEVPVVA